MLLFSSSSFLHLHKMITDIHGVPIQEALQTEGYVIIDNLIPEETFDDLVEACDRVVDRARRGDWKYRYFAGCT